MPSWPAAARHRRPFRARLSARSCGLACGHTPGRLARSRGRLRHPPPLGLPQHAPGFARRNAMSAARSRAEGAPAAPCRAMRAARGRCVRFVACLHLLTLVAVSWTVLGPRARARGVHKGRRRPLQTLPLARARGPSPFRPPQRGSGGEDKRKRRTEHRERNILNRSRSRR